MSSPTAQDGDAGPGAPTDGPPSTLILIPACNEVGRIEKVIEGLRDAGIDANAGMDILVVDDGSSDETAKHARALGATVLIHPFNLGYGAALQTGYIYAQRRGYERLVQMDADGQHDPSSVLPLLARLASGWDIVLGSRFQVAGMAPATSFMRRTGSRVFAYIVTRWTGTTITDPTSGFQALSRRAIQAVAADGFPEDYPDADVLIRLATSGLKLSEIPVKMHERIGGVSMHRGTRAAYYAYKMFISLALLRVRRASPYRRVYARS